MSGPLSRLRSRLHFWRQERRRRIAVATAGGAFPIRAEDAGDLVLARVVGNDLHPRHGSGQALRNLAFILDNEADFPGCRKVFVLNRIFDQDTEQDAKRLVEKHGHEAMVLPFLGEEYIARECDTSVFGGDAYFLSDAFASLKENAKDRERLWACVAKVHYAMNINGARNAALERGRQLGKWTLLLDGGCFVRADAIERLRASLASPPFVPYVVVPMQRLVSNDDAARIELASDSVEEPQIAIHACAPKGFDEIYPYGLRDKVSLLQRIGVPGPWDRWGNYSWLPKVERDAAELFMFKYADTSVLRLSSGASTSMLDGKGSHSIRYQSRNKAVLRTLAMLDDRFGSPDRERARRIMDIPHDWKT